MMNNLFKRLHHLRTIAHDCCKWAEANSRRSMRLPIEHRGYALEQLEERSLLAATTLQIAVNLYEDAGSSPGALIADDTVVVGDSFFAEVVAGDIRTTPAGIIGLPIDVDWEAAIFEEIDDPFDPTDEASPLVTSKFPLMRGGTLDNTTGFIDELTGGSLPNFGMGEAIGIGSLERFSLLHFQAAAVSAGFVPLEVSFGSSGCSFADGITDFELDIETQTIHVIPAKTIRITDSSGAADDASVQFSTALTEYRPLATADSPLVRPAFPDAEQYIDVTNDGDSPLTLYEIQVNAPNVTIDPPLTSDPGDDIELAVDGTQRFQLTYAPARPSTFPFDPTNENFCLADGLVILSDATNDPNYEVVLRGTSTFNSDITYDGKVDLGELGPLNANWGKNPSDPDWDPTADINGDDVVDLGELSPLTSEFNLSLPLVLLVESDDSTQVAEGGAADTYTLKLNREPTGNVEVAITPDSQTQVDLTPVTFTPIDWNVPQTITVTAVDDGDIEGAHLSYIVHTTSSTDTEYDGLPVTFASSLGIPRLSDSCDLIATVTDNDLPPGGPAMAGMPSPIAPLPAGLLEDAVFGSGGGNVAESDNAEGEADELDLLRWDEAVSDQAQLVERQRPVWTDDLAWTKAVYSARKANTESDKKDDEKVVDLVLARISHRS